LALGSGVTPPRRVDWRHPTKGVSMSTSDHLPDVHHDTELEMAEESKPALQPEHGPGSAPMMDLE
jgi:hypothetical protein